VCRQIIERAVEELGGLDILVNNAAYQMAQPGGITDITDEQFDRVMKTNLYAMFWLCREAVPHLQAGSATAEGCAFPTNLDRDQEQVTGSHTATRCRGGGRRGPATCGPPRLRTAAGRWRRVRCRGGGRGGGQRALLLVPDPWVEDAVEDVRD
jgi:NAD(P)-dependent dehydrogenase (short-subunit alcohol dehydrogenase family)